MNVGINSDLILNSSFRERVEFKSVDILSKDVKHGVRLLF